MVFRTQNHEGGSQWLAVPAGALITVLSFAVPQSGAQGRDTVALVGTGAQITHDVASSACSTLTVPASSGTE